MNNNNNQEKKPKKPASYFRGPGADIDPSPMNQDTGVTRRAAAFGGGVSFQPVIASELMQQRMGNSATVKAGTSVKQAPAAAAAAKPKAKPKSAYVWDLKEVPTLPEFHPLERTADFVTTNDPSEVTKRVSKVLWERSIEAKYDNEKAKVKCVSPEGVEFRVRLYRGRGVWSVGVIVEVQRRSGSSPNFGDHVKAILKGAFPPRVPRPAAAVARSSSALPLVSDTEEDHAPSRAESQKTIKWVEKLFIQGAYDSKLLALQTLSSLTNSKKIGPTTAKSVSAEVLSSSNDIGNIIIGLLQQGSDDEGNNLRFLAFTILANTLEATKGEEEDQVVRESTRPILLKELSTAESNPRNAQMAAKCFEFLYKGDHDQGEIAMALEAAQQVGEIRLAGLAAQTKRTLEKMAL
jgi:hypothetical protein